MSSGSPMRPNIAFAAKRSSVPCQSAAPRPPRVMSVRTKPDATAFTVMLRKAQPYECYADFNFDIAIGKNGDNYDRYCIRMEEMRQSIRDIAKLCSWRCVSTSDFGGDPETPRSINPISARAEILPIVRFRI